MESHLSLSHNCFQQILAYKCRCNQNQENQKKRHQYEYKSLRFDMDLFCKDLLLRLLGFVIRLVLKSWDINKQIHFFADVFNNLSYTNSYEIAWTYKNFVFTFYSYLFDNFFQQILPYRCKCVQETIR